jgi:predicted Zn finger-like uncharacterized protein
MNVSCPECRAVYRIDPAKVSSVSLRARCSLCGGIILVGESARWGDDFGSTERESPSEPSRRLTPGARSGSESVSTPARTSGGVASQTAPRGARQLTPPFSSPSIPRGPSTRSGVPAADVARPPAIGSTAREMPTPMVASPSVVPHMESPAFGAPLPPPRRPSGPMPPSTASGPPAASQIVAAGSEHVVAAPASLVATPADLSAHRGPINPFLARDPNQKARRLARALVSDMIAYHPSKREEGLRNGTLKQLFREEIKKSYEEYVEQVGRELAETSTHFQDALNDVLGGGRKIF